MNGPPSPHADTALAAERGSQPGFRAGVLAGGLVVLLLGAIAIAGVLLFRPAGSPEGVTPEQAAALQARADREQAQAQALSGQLAAADAELAVERAARRALEDNLAGLQTQAGQLRDRLAFYDQLFPAGPAGTVSIRALEVARVPAGLRYRVLLMRSARPGLAPFVGGLQFIATGTRDGAQVRLPLAPLAGPIGQDTGAPGKAESGDPVDPSPSVSSVMPLEVDQYRSSEGILALPPDFTPMDVSVDVIQDGTVLVSQQAAVAF